MSEKEPNWALPDRAEFAGFWIRVVATVIDSILLIVVTLPILYAIYGDRYFDPDQLIVGFWDFLLSWIFPAVAIIVFWHYRSATPGKIMLKMQILDADSGGQPTTRQFVIRYFSYFISSLPMGAGMLWVAFDERKQGWHDKIARTVVIRQRNRRDTQPGSYPE